MRESKNLEYKENTGSNTYMKTISAYANYGDGEIIFGIADDGKTVGIPDPERECLNLENKINDSIKPVPKYRLEVRDDSTILLTVFEGRYKPYLYKGKAYKRNASATVETERLEYNRLILEGRNQSFEELPSEEQNLTFLELEKELVRTLGIQKLSTDILKTLELYSEREGFNNAAALLADDNSFKGVDIVRFGDDINEIMDRESFEKTSILIQMKKSMEMFRKYYQYEKIEGMERKVLERVPENAFREALANALVHRLWDMPASVKISMYKDRIEISSPGGLPAGISREEYLDGQISMLRNPIIGNVFFRLRYIEKFGTGIMRINNAYAGALKKPSYKIYENSILVVLPVIEADNVLTDFEKRVVDILMQNEDMTRAGIEKAIGAGKDKTIRALNALLEKNVIGRKGMGRGTRYSML